MLAPPAPSFSLANGACGRTNDFYFPALISVCKIPTTTNIFVHIYIYIYIYRLSLSLYI